MDHISRGISLPSFEELETNRTSAIPYGDPESLIESGAPGLSLDHHGGRIAAGTSAGPVADGNFASLGRLGTVDTIPECDDCLSIRSLTGGENAVARTGAGEVRHELPGLAVHFDSNANSRGRGELRHGGIVSHKAAPESPPR